jgi:hypothetical protein
MALRPVVRPPVLGDVRDHAIDCFREAPPRLVAVGAQVAFPAVVGRAFDSEERHRIGGLQGKVSGGESGVDLVTGAAVLAGWMWIPSL